MPKTPHSSCRPLMPLIRSSPAAVSRSRRRQDRQPAHGRVICLRRRCSTAPHLSSPAPVSYTHLRAHETRHDLVCRLLLEKKKKRKTIDKPSIMSSNTQKRTTKPVVTI